MIFAERPAILNGEITVGPQWPFEQTRGTTYMIWRIVKYLLILLVLAAIALAGYAVIGPVLFPADFAAPTQTVTEQVTLELD